VQRVLELRRQGWSIKEIATEVDYHPATVSKWLRAGGPPGERRVNPSERVIDDRWTKRIDALIAPPSKLLARSVFEIIAAEGYRGSYPSVVRHVRARRGPRFRVAPQVSVPIETGPGEESQFDFSDCSERGRQFAIADTLWCFGAILCWSRHLSWWFTTLSRSPAHDGGPRAALRARRWRSQGGSHRSHGGTWDLSRQALRPPPFDDRLLLAPWGRDQGLFRPGTRSARARSNGRFTLSRRRSWKSLPSWGRRRRSLSSTPSPRCGWRSG